MTLHNRYVHRAPSVPVFIKQHHWCYFELGARCLVRARGVSVEQGLPRISLIWEPLEPDHKISRFARF